MFSTFGEELAGTPPLDLEQQMFSPSLMPSLSAIRIAFTHAYLHASAGYIVMRYHCAGKEQRRLRIFEKAVDTAAMSPFARHVTRWVLAGVGEFMKAPRALICPTGVRGSTLLPALLHGSSCVIPGCLCPCALQKCVSSPNCGPLFLSFVFAPGNGARVAASVGGKCRGYMAGYALMGYPLMVGRTGQGLLASAMGWPA